MRFYNVKQIAGLLETNPETVRRWIREGKLNAIQSSRKSGNLVTDDDLNRFVRTMPKYSSKVPMAGQGLVVLAGILATCILKIQLEKKSEPAKKISLEDLRQFLEKEAENLTSEIEERQEMIQRLDSEVANLTQKVEQYQYLISHEEFLEQALHSATTELKEI